VAVEQPVDRGLVGHVDLMELEGLVAGPS